MRLDVSQLQSDGFNQVTASHKGETLVWGTGTYGKVKLQNPRGVFDEINAYWEWEAPDVGERVWNALIRIKETLDDGVDAFQIDRECKEAVEEMYGAMSLERIQQWMLTRGNLYFPPDVHDSMAKTGRYKNPSQTYLKEDYINLAVLSIALRPMALVWGEYIEQGAQGTGGDRYKEMGALFLIKDTELMAWPASNAAMEKLENYIQFASDETPVSLASLWRGLGTAEIPIWLLANVLIRRLTIVPLTDHNQQVNIVAYVYRYVKSKLKPAERRAQDRVTEKKPDNRGGDEDDKTSLLEEYKVKQRLSDGDARMYSRRTRDMVGIAQSVDPTIDVRLIDICSQYTAAPSRVRINPHQVLMAQWVLAKGFSPRAFDHIEKASVVRLLATTQALLWYWGYHDLACLMLVERVVTTDQDAPGLTSRSKNGQRIKGKYIPDLQEMYPHGKHLRPKETNGRNGSVAAMGINSLTRDILGGNWHYLGPDELWQVSNQPAHQRIVVIPQQIKNTITEMTLHIASLNQ